MAYISDSRHNENENDTTTTMTMTPAIQPSSSTNPSLRHTFPSHPVNRSPIPPCISTIHSNAVMTTISILELYYSIMFTTAIHIHNIYAYFISSHHVVVYMFIENPHHLYPITYQPPRL